MGDRVSEAGTLRVRCGRGMRRAGWLGGVVWHGRRKESREEARKVEWKKEGRKDGQREGLNGKGSLAWSLNLFVALWDLHSLNRKSVVVIQTRI